MTSAEQVRLDALRAFAARPKFIPTDRYTGIDDLSERQRFGERMNQLARELEPLVMSADAKPALLRALERAWPTFEMADTEDREVALEYFEELMALFGVKSSDGLLNRLAYGFDAQLSPDARQRAALAVMTPEERALIAEFERLSAANAPGELLRLLGPPQLEQPQLMGWMRGEDMKNLISLTQIEGQWVLSWLLRGQLWGRTLPAQ
jgi:hypothetical protein